MRRVRPAALLDRCDCRISPCLAADLAISVWHFTKGCTSFHIVLCDLQSLPVLACKPYKARQDQAWWGTGAPGAAAAEQEAAAASVGETPGPSGAEGTSRNAQAAQQQAALDAKDKEVRGVVWFGHGRSHCCAPANASTCCCCMGASNFEF